jgi:hypothetical protein
VSPSPFGTDEPQQLLVFTEPDIAFSLEQRRADRVRVRVHFSLEALPPWLHGANQPDRSVPWLAGAAELSPADATAVAEALSAALAGRSAAEATHALQEAGVGAHEVLTTEQVMTSQPARKLGLSLTQRSEEFGRIGRGEHPGGGRPGGAND